MSKDFATQTKQLSVWGTKAELRGGLVDRKLVGKPPPSPVNFVAGSPKAALLFRFFMFVLLS